MITSYGIEVKYRGYLDYVTSYEPVSYWFDTPAECETWLKDKNVKYDFIGSASNWHELRSYSRV